MISCQSLSFLEMQDKSPTKMCHLDIMEKDRKYYTEHIISEEGGARLKFIIPYLLFIALYLVFNYGAHLDDEEDIDETL